MSKNNQPNFFRDIEYKHRYLNPRDIKFVEDLTRLFKYSSPRNRRRNADLLSEMVFNNIKSRFLTHYETSPLEYISKRIHNARKVITFYHHDLIPEDLNLDNLKTIIKSCNERVVEVNYKRSGVRFPNYRWPEDYPSSYRNPIHIHAPSYFRQVILNSRKLFASYYEPATVEEASKEKIITDLEERYSIDVTETKIMYGKKEKISRRSDDERKRAPLFDVNFI